MTGQVLPELAERMGLTGLAGRASGQAYDLRADQPIPPYTAIPVRKCGHARGDVAARVSVRFDELFESVRWLEEVIGKVPEGAIHAPLPAPAAGKTFGWIEGWRGEVFVALDIDAGGRLYRVHAHDPSWQNWPLLERAVLGNIVPDFPLINKSFNLSYSGQDL
jgi:Ni,Fe-hydrogenase III large subunit